jgi:hypothetical protein
MPLRASPALSRAAGAEWAMKGPNRFNSTMIKIMTTKKFTTLRTE